MVPAGAGAPRPRILVIDDEEHFARLLQDFFEHCGYEVTVSLGGLDLNYRYSVR